MCCRSNGSGGVSISNRSDLPAPSNGATIKEEGNPRKHVSPDLLVALGIRKEPKRDYYLVWKEGKAPDFILEITSKTTRREDEKKKRVLCRDVLKVPEYFLFDPRAEYLDPPLQGFRLIGGEYVRTEPIAGRSPSEILGLHLERDREIEAVRNA